MPRSPSQKSITAVAEEGAVIIEHETGVVLTLDASAALESSEVLTDAALRAVGQKRIRADRRAEEREGR